MNRPRGLREVSILMAVMGVLSYSFVKYRTISASLAIDLLTAYAVTALIVLWFFWQGHNWARIFVLLNCVLTLWSLEWLPHYQLLHQVLLIAETVLALWLLYWLNTAPLRRYFEGARVKSAA